MPDDFPNSLALAAEKGLMEERWITIIDENGFWRGQVLDTPSVRSVLRGRFLMDKKKR